MSIDAQLPQDHAIERSVLGSILINNACMDRVAGIVETPHFAKTAHQTIFGAMVGMAMGGVEIDFATVTDRLSTTGDLERIGGRSYILGLTDGIPDIANVERYARIVREKANLRDVIKTCNHGMQQAMQGKASAEVVSEIQGRLLHLGANEDIASRGIYTVALEARLEADARAARGEMVGVQTGFSLLDDMTLGLPREALSVLGARTSHGKTTLGLNLLMSAVETNPSTKVALYSLEMSKQAVTDSIKARISGVPLGAIRDWARLNVVDRQRVLDAEADLVQFNQRFYFADRINTLADVVTDARMKHQEGGLDLVMVDYLQLVEGGEEETRERTVNQIAWRLAELAKDLKIAVLALSQVTPAADQRKDGRLSIDDIRDAKAVGHHARLVLLMSRPWQSNKARTDVLPCHAIVQVEKQSQGPTGDLVYHFDGAFQSFSEGKCDGCRTSRNAGYPCEECGRAA